MPPPRFVRPARAAVAMLAVALAGCGHDPATRFAPAPIVRSTAVSVRDTLDAPVEGASVFARRLDVFDLVLGVTDSAGVARFTLAEGRWAVYTHPLNSSSVLQRVAGGTGRVPSATAGVSDTVLFRLRLAIQSVATGRFTLAGRSDHSGTIVIAEELPLTATTNAAGDWELDGLPPGVWTGTADQFGFRTAVFDVPVAGSDDTITVAAAVLQPGGPPGVPR